MKLKRGRFSLGIGFPELCAAALMIGAGKGTTLLIAVLSAAAHECGHIAAMRLCGAGVREVNLSPVGGEILPEGGMLSYRKDILIAAAGPAVSAVMAGLLFLAYSLTRSQTLLQAAAANAVYAAANLLPAAPLDGYRILRGILYIKDRPDTEKRLRTAGVFTVTVLFLLFIWATLRTGFNPSILIFIVFLVLHLKQG